MDELEQAMSLRKKEKPEEALVILKKLLLESPNHPQINYQAAWICDSMGRESEAVPYYEAAIANGLKDEELRGAFLGLGSTYRCLGKYQKSLETFDHALAEFPQDRPLKVFKALTSYNLGQFSSAVEELLVQLLDTTCDDNIKSYEKALRFYSDKLDQVWE